MRLPYRIYRLLLWLYPSGFRDEYQVPLQRQFKDDYAELRTRRDHVRFWLGTAIDLLQSAPSQFGRELRQDSAHTLRLWRRNPSPTILAIVVLAIAIGANTGVFSVLNALVLRSLPFREPERLVVLRNVGIPRDEFHTWRQQRPYLEDAATYDTIDVNLDGGYVTGRMRLTETSWNFFALFGAEAVVGRTFAPGEDAPGSNAVTVLGHAVWHQLFGANPRIVGSTIRVNGTLLTVVGVAPRGFDYPQKTELWTPTTFDFRRIPKTGSALFFYSIGRLKPGWSWAQADQAAKTEAAGTARRDEPVQDIDRAAVRPLQQELAGPVARASMILMCGVGLLLLLACANLANLLLARTVSRSHELMVRMALGASRARLVQQLLTEAVLLSLVATAASLLVAVWSAAIATSVQPPQLSSQSYTILDWRVLIFAIGLSCLTGLVFGAGPALYVGRRGFSEYGRYNVATVTRSGARPWLVATQIAIAIVLLTGSISLGRAFISLMRVDLGYDLDSIATMHVSHAGSSRAANGGIAAYYEDVIRRVRDVPGVLAVSMTESLPLAIDGVAAAEFQLDNAGPQSGLTVLTSVSPAYFATIGTPVITGREFMPSDLTSGEAVAIVNEEFARAFGGPSAVVGRSVTASGWPARRIVGVVRGMRYAGPAFNPRPQIFHLSKAPRSATIVAKVAGPARERLAMIRDAVQSIDPKVPVFNVQTMDARLAATLARPRFYTTAVVFFGGLALLLAIAGIYGTVSYGVLQRTREMGIRLALGTTPPRLRAMLLRQTLAIISAGAIVGVAAALGAGRYLQSLVEGAGGAMPLTASFAVVGTLLVAAAAVWRATRHIARLDVADVLRSETE